MSISSLYRFIDCELSYNYIGFRYLLILVIRQEKISAEDTGHIEICYRRVLIDTPERYTEYIFSGVSIKCNCIDLDRYLLMTLENPNEWRFNDGTFRTPLV
jgi:hypothetical protein